LSTIVRHLSSTGAWKTMPTSAIGRVTERPPTTTRPVVAGRSPAMILRSVDLPQPDGPTSARNSPWSTVNEIPLSASTGPLAAW
jgi:hypothetical protein